MARLLRNFLLDNLCFQNQLDGVAECSIKFPPNLVVSCTSFNNSDFPFFQDLDPIQDLRQNDFQLRAYLFQSQSKHLKFLIP